MNALDKYVYLGGNSNSFDYHLDPPSIEKMDSIGGSATNIPVVGALNDGDDMISSAFDPVLRYIVGIMILTIGLPIALYSARWILNFTCFRCTRFQKRLSKRDCKNILNDYYNDNSRDVDTYKPFRTDENMDDIDRDRENDEYNGDDNDSFVISMNRYDENDESRSLREKQKKQRSNYAQDASTVNAKRLETDAIQQKTMLANYAAVSTVLNNPLYRVGSTINRDTNANRSNDPKQQNAFDAMESRRSSNFKNGDGSTRIKKKSPQKIIRVKKSKIGNKSQPFYRDNMVKFVYAIFSLWIVATILTVALWIIGTDPSAVFAVLGIATTALVFSGGFMDFFKNYIAYLWLLFSDKFKVGELIYIQGITPDYACVRKFEPLYVVVMLYQPSLNHNRMELPKKHIPNTLFVTSVTDKLSEWELLERKRKNFVPGESVNKTKNVVSFSFLFLYTYCCPSYNAILSQLRPRYD